MKMEKVSVKLKGAEVAVIDVEQFENIDEAIQTLGDTAVVSLVNRQHKADMGNAKRGEFRPSAAGKKKIRQLAFELCGKDDKLAKELQKHMGTLDKMTEFLDSLTDRVKEAYNLP